MEHQNFIRHELNFVMFFMKFFVNQRLRAYFQDNTNAGLKNLKRIPISLITQIKLHRLNNAS